MILVFTSKHDPHADAVIREFDRRGTPVFRLNSEDLLVDYEISLSLDGRASGAIRNAMGRSLDLKDLRVGWLRKPEMDFRQRALLDSGVREYVVSETKALINSLYALPSVCWVNDPFAAALAKVKSRQLLLARASRMVSTPRTLITTKPEEAIAFARACPAGVAIKSIYTSNVTIDGVNRGIPTQRLTVDQLKEDADSVRLCPTQLQEYVPKAFELRVTVFGDAVVAIRINSQERPETEVDWRTHTLRSPHFLFVLPDRIAEFCRAIVAQLGLLYGALDLIVTPNGNYVFLEVNPFGQYLWLEDLTGAPLTSMMCDLLLGPKADLAAR